MKIFSKFSYFLLIINIIDKNIILCTFCSNSKTNKLFCTD